VVSPRYLLDANVLSEPLKPIPHPGVLVQIERHRAESASAAPVWNELVYGCRRLPESKRRRTIEKYLSALAAVLTILPYDQRAADRHGSERARLEAVGKTPPFVDGQIASVAQVHDLILVTRNGDDFGHFDGLRVEDWWETIP